MTIMVEGKPKKATSEEIVSEKLSNTDVILSNNVVILTNNDVILSNNDVILTLSVIFWVP